MGKGNPLHCWWECKMIEELWGTVQTFLQKLRIELSYDSTISLLNLYPKETITGSNPCTPVFIAILFTIARTWKQPKWPLTDE